MTEKLTANQRTEMLPALKEAGWSETDGRDAIKKTYEFRNFVEAFGFMSKAALWAEKMTSHSN